MSFISGVIQSDETPKRQRGDHADRMAEGYVRTATSSLQGSSRIMMTDRVAKVIFRRAERDVDRLETELGRSLPKARAALESIRGDAWANIT